ncbi:DoxX family protein [Spirosoma soli]|uniref:DoxX family protein n=1 Tax=Spirosoma soli TaxID=1770529 RepID=A0ABW5M088_9BACT
MNTINPAAMPLSTVTSTGNRKFITILYWTLTGLFSLLMLMDGIAGVTREETGQEVMRHLGYPIYAMVIFGIAKILGAIALIQPKFQTIKEWAYAGFTINFLGAFASRAFVGDDTGLLIAPVFMLAVLFVTYFVWKKFEQAKKS